MTPIRGHLQMHVSSSLTGAAVELLRRRLQIERLLRALIGSQLQERHHPLGKLLVAGVGSDRTPAHDLPAARRAELRIP